MQECTFALHTATFPLNRLLSQYNVGEFLKFETHNVCGRQVYSNYRRDVLGGTQTPLLVHTSIERDLLTCCANLQIHTCVINECCRKMFRFSMQYYTNSLSRNLQSLYIHTHTHTHMVTIFDELSVDNCTAACRHQESVGGET